MPRTAPERDFQLLEARINNFNGRQGPRVGDFVIMPGETFLRFTHDWSDVGGGIQTTCPESTNQSFYFSEQGFCDYSGSLDEPLPIEALEDTLQNRQGSVWFFHRRRRDYPRAHNSVQAKVPFRVYRYRPATPAA